MDQDFSPEAPPDFQKKTPENKPEGDRQVTPGQGDRQSTAFHDELYKYNQGDTTVPAGQDVGRVSDRAKFREDAGQARTSIIKDLEDAKKAMLATNEIVKAGGGPYSANERGRADYMGALEAGHKAYEQAQRKADQLLYDVDPQTGKPRLDEFGEPVKSNFHKQLRTEYGQLQQEIKQLQGNNSPEARQALAQKMQQAEDIKDLTRMSGYARANRGLALLFGVAHLRGEDAVNQRTAGNAELMMASKFDASMMGPPPDRNFMKHYLKAQQVAGVEQAPPRPDQTQPRPDQTQPRPDQTQPRPDQTQPRPDQTQPRPDQTRPRPDQAQPQPEIGVVNDGKQFRHGNYLLPNGNTVLQVPRDGQGRPMAVDGKPAVDDRGAWRTGADGLPIRPKLDGRDPGQLVEAAIKTIGADGKLSDAGRAGFVDSIKASDELNRESIAARMMQNNEAMKKLPDAMKWFSDYTTLTEQQVAKQNQLRNQIGTLAGSLNQQQGPAFNAMWEGVTDPTKLDAWLADPKNAQHKTVLESHPQWAGIKAKFGEFLAANPANSPELKAKEGELARNPKLAGEVNQVRAMFGENLQMQQLYLSSITNRVGYLDVLTAQKDVQDYMRLSPEQKAQSPLKDNADVKAARQLMAELAGLDKEFLDASKPKGQAFAERARFLGVTFDRPAAPPQGDGQPVKPGDNQPPRQGDGQQPAPETGGLTQAQETAVARASEIRQRFITETKGGTEKMAPEKWQALKAEMEAAVKDANDIKPEALDGILGKAQLNYQGQLKQILSMQTATPEQMQAKQTELMTQYITVNQNLSRAVDALSPENKTKLGTMQQTYEQEVNAKKNELITKAQTESGGDQAKLQQLIQAAEPGFQTWLQERTTKFTEEKKALSPELKAAMEAQNAFMSKPEGVLTAQLAQITGTVEQLRHSGGISRLYYAQMLAAQGETDAAKTQLTEASKSEQVRQLLNQTQEGRALAEGLGIKTPEMAALEAEAAKQFPELAKFDEAMKILGDKSKDPKQAFAEAQAKFEEAIKLTEGRNVKQLRDSANALKLTLEGAMKEIQEGKRTELTASEKEKLAEVQKLENQANNVSLLRFRYAMALNDYGHKQNDDAAKAKSIQMLESIEKVDPMTFVGSPEIQGALMQARKGKPIDIATAPSEAFVNAATNTIASHGSGFADFFVPGASSTVNALSGNRAPNIPMVGPMLFGGGKEVQERTVQQLAQAYLSNADATQKNVDTQVNQGKSVLREVGSDVLAVGGGLATRWGLNTFAPKMMQGPWYMKAAGVGLQFAVAGGLKDVAADGQLGTGTDWLRGTGMYGGSLLLMRGMSLDPSRKAMSVGTTDALATRYGLDQAALQGASSKTFAEAMFAEQKTLQAAVKAGGAASPEAAKLAVLDASLGSRMSRIGSRLNPMNYNPLSSHVWSAEAAGTALANGELSMGQYLARQGAGRLYTVGGSSFLFGAGREGLYIATGQRQMDGSEHSLQSALTSMGTSGLQTSLSTMVFLPMAGSFANSIPGVNRLVNGTGNLMASGLTRVGVPATAAAPAAWYAMPQVSVAGLSNLALVGASPTLRGFETYSQAKSLEEAAVTAKKLAEDARKKAEAELAKKNGQ